MKIQTVGRILVLTLLAINLVFIIIGGLWLRGYSELESQWAAYNKTIELKSELIDVLHDAFGHHGIGLHLERYAKTAEPTHLSRFQTLIRETTFALATYRRLILSEKEKTIY